MPGCLAREGEDPGERGRDFQASLIGDRFSNRQAIEPSLVALQPWQVRIVTSLSWR
jgi:hypothetical protein